MVKINLFFVSFGSTKTLVTLNQITYLFQGVHSAPISCNNILDVKAARIPATNVPIIDW